jgi:hypothetical protein
VARPLARAKRNIDAPSNGGYLKQEDIDKLPFVTLKGTIQSNTAKIEVQPRKSADSGNGAAAAARAAAETIDTPPSLRSEPRRGGARCTANDIGADSTAEPSGCL